MKDVPAQRSSSPPFKCVWRAVELTESVGRGRSMTRKATALSVRHVTAPSAAGCSVPTHIYKNKQHLPSRTLFKAWWRDLCQQNWTRLCYCFSLGSRNYHQRQYLIILILMRQPKWVNLQQRKCLLSRARLIVLVLYLQWQRWKLWF